MNAPKIMAFAMSMLIGMTTHAEDPRSIEVRYLHAAIWPKTFDATPGNRTNIYTGTRSTNMVLVGNVANLAPIPFYTKAFGTNTPELVWVNEVRVLRYDAMHTNYFTPYFYRGAAMRKATNFTAQVLDGDIVYFTRTVD